MSSVDTVINPVALEAAADLFRQKIGMLIDDGAIFWGEA